MRLILGAGRVRTRRGIRIDLNPAVRPHVVATVLALPFMDYSVGEILAEDILEHLSYRSVPAALSEWLRVLRPCGRLFVQVPDAATIFEWYVSHPERLIVCNPTVPHAGTAMAGAQWRLLGGQDDGIYADDSHGDLNLHRSLFSEASLCAHLVDAGFEIQRVTRSTHPDLQVWAMRPPH